MSRPAWNFVGGPRVRTPKRHAGAGKPRGAGCWMRPTRQVSIHYVELADYLAIAAEITELDINTLIRVTKVDLAESALHAPAAGFGETEFYPDFIDKAAVLVVRLAKNHPLPDGNKRAACPGGGPASPASCVSHVVRNGRTAGRSLSATGHYGHAAQGSSKIALAIADRREPFHPV
jgi:hypothetical protein